VLHREQVIVFDEHPDLWSVEIFNADGAATNEGSNTEKKKEKKPNALVHRKTYEAPDMTQLSFENGDIPIVEMQFKGEKLHCLFSDDGSREKFKVRLFQKIKSNGFKKGMEAVTELA